MTNELRNKLYNLFYQHIQGGSTDTFESILDQAIEDGELSQADYRSNEIEITGLFDDHWFTCVVCGWTMPIEENGEDTEGGELQCRDCAEDED